MPDLDYVKVTGRFGLTVGDGPDADENPDTVWCDEGIVRIIPLNTYTKVAGGAPSPWTAGHSVIEVPIDGEGRLSWSGQPHVWLVDLTSDKVNPRIGSGKATHRVEFKNLKAAGVPVAFETQTVRLAADSVDPLTGAVDLTLALPVPTAGGTPIVVGPQGVGVSQLIQPSVGKFAFALTNGETTNEIELPVGPAGPASTVPGPQGLPGVNAVPTDQAVATYASTPDTATAQAIAAKIGAAAEVGGAIRTPLEGVFAKKRSRRFDIVDYGAKVDTREFYSGVTTTAGSNVLTVTGAGFTNGDVGKVFTVPGAGPSGAFFQATIASRTNATTVTLSTAADTAVSNGKGTIGTDDTAALQAAVNACVAAGGGEVWKSKRGTSLLAGPQQTGTALTWNYSAQILFPAQPILNPITVVLEGSVAYPSLLNPNNPELASMNVDYKSTAQTGKVIDAIPAGYIASNVPFTNIMLKMRDFSLRLPNNPQVDVAVDGRAFSRMQSEGSNSIDVDAGGQQLIYPTGNGYGLMQPAMHNQAMNHMGGDFQIVGFPNGWELNEHSTGENIAAMYCRRAIGIKASSSHGIKYNRILVQRCNTVLFAEDIATYGGTIEATIDVEAASSNGYEAPWALTWMVDDPGSRLSGKVNFHFSQQPGGGMPVRGAVNLNMSDTHNGSVGWFETAPVDTFKRIAGGLPWLTGSAYLGTTDQSVHPWSSPALSSLVAIDANGVYCPNTASVGQVCRYINRTSPGGSRTTIMDLKTGASGYRVAATFTVLSSTNSMWLQLEGGTVTLRKKVANTNTTLATSAAGVVAGGTAYRMVVTFAKPIGAPWLMTAYLNGTQVFQYTFTTQDMLDLPDAPSTNGGGILIRDGFSFTNDTGSRISMWRSVPGID